MNSPGKFRYWLPVFLWMAVIFWLSTNTFSSVETSRLIEPVIRFLVPGISDRKVHIIHGLIRKCGHLTEYFVLGVLLFRAFRRGSAKLTARAILYSVIIIALYAASDEFHQTFVYSRTPSLVDVGIDTAGGMFAQFTYLLCRHRRDTG